ncbi:hypothetical protein SADUNF_Sadunf18G0039600 [Salix dunnii]|uniref:Uncharacterized protein n=1 Tax=Salix dunnii TaxID=1413687 RepID=A0A835J5V6_9ROSI|nr:hypothetical protein SADUNF_Sadunf18G0039600 [Salix dunnii]
MYGQGSFNPQSGGQGSQTPIAPPYSHCPPPLPHNFQLGPPPHTGQLSLPPPQHLPAHGGTANAVQPYLHSSTAVRGIAPFQHVYAPAQHSSYLASGPPPPPPFDLHRLEMLQAPLPPRGLPPPPPPSQGQRLYNSLPQQLAGVHGLQRIPPPPPPPPLPTSSFSSSAPFGSSAESNGANPQMLSTAPPPPPPPPSSTSSAPPIPPSPPQPNSHMLPLSAPVLAGSYPLFHSDIASNSSKPSGDKLGTTGSANVAIPLNQGGNSVHGNLYLEGGSGTEEGCELDEAKNFSQPNHLMVAAGAHMPAGSDSDMEMEVEWFPDWFYCVILVPRGLSPSYSVKKWHFCVLDDASLECLLVIGRKNDITQSDNDQAAKHPIGYQIHCIHLIAGDSDVTEQLHELQSSARSDAATIDLSVPGSSRLDNGQQGSKINSCHNQLTSGKTVSEVHSPVINPAGADGKSSSRATEAAGCVNSDKYSSDVLKGGSPFRLLQDYASEDSSENNDESYLKNTIPKTASKLVTVGSEDLQLQQQQQQLSYCFSHFASDNVHVLSGKIGSSSVLPPDILDSNQLSCLPNIAVSKNSTLPNNYPASFELPFNSKFSSDVLRQENVASYTRKVDHSSSWNHASLDGQDASVGSRQPIPSPNSARDVAQIIPRTGSDQYDPFFDSIEPTSNSFKRLDHIQKWESSNIDIMPRLSSSEKLLDVEENNKKEVRNIALSTSLDNEEFGETADAEVGDVEDQSQNNPVVVNVNMGDMEIDQAKSPGKSKNSKESRSMKLFKVALADFVKDILKPSWRQGNMSKEAFKTIVKKTVDKVTGAMKSHQIPKSKAKIDHYIDSSQWKLTKLVMVNPPFFYFDAAKLSLNDAF